MIKEYRISSRNDEPSLPRVRFCIIDSQIYVSCSSRMWVAKRRDRIARSSPSLLFPCRLFVCICRRGGLERCCTHTYYTRTAAIAILSLFGEINRADAMSLEPARRRAVPYLHLSPRAAFVRLQLWSINARRKVC